MMTLAIMAVAGYLHTVSGFGLGMIVMGAAGGLGVASIPVLAAWSPWSTVPWRCREGGMIWDGDGSQR